MVKEDKTFDNNLIKIGENAKDNDNIIKESKETDVWFHISNLPSCHVIIECSKEHPINKQMIAHCANLTKENGKYKNISKIKINYTEIKNVKRTLVPGKVMINGKIKSIIV